MNCILLRFKDGDCLAPYSKLMDDISELTDIRSPFDPDKKPRVLKRTNFHNLNSKRQRVIVYKEQEPS